MLYDLLPKSFIAFALILALGLFGTGAYFLDIGSGIAKETAGLEAAIGTLTQNKQPSYVPAPKVVVYKPSENVEPALTELPVEKDSKKIETKPASAKQVTTSPFKRYLSIGSTGADVKTLQVLLNNQGFPIATSGPGSKGRETSKFGGATAKAVAKLQCERGIVCEGTPETTGYGSLDDTTREIVNALYNLTSSASGPKRK